MSMLSSFARQCRTAPESLALCEADRLLTYRQVAQRARALSLAIIDCGDRCQRVAIAVDRGIDAAIAVLAVLGAGACYVPLDMKNPPDRLHYIVEDADPECIVGKGPCPAWLQKPGLWLDIEQYQSSINGGPWPKDVDLEALAAILYTSGSTGQPKGVALSHRALLNFIDWSTAVFHITAGDRIASLAPFHFDLSVFDLFAGLSSGASVHFVPSWLALAPSRLSAWLGEQCITLFYTVPSLLGFLTLKGSLAATPVPHLRTILFAGEVFPTSTLKTLCELLPKVQFFNLYGPTETNVCCYWPVDRARLNDGRPIPIGVPAGNAILDIDPDTGELRVQSANNLSGYWQQGRLVDVLSHDGFHATGDKVSVNEFGELCFHGRLDRMLKCSGYRVEPAEIEAVMLQCPDVIGCAVIGVTDSASGQRPVAALVLKPGADLSEITRSVKSRLPAYMHPVKMTALKALPSLSNGKIDYQSLQQQLEGKLNA